MSDLKRSALVGVAATVPSSKEVSKVAAEAGNKLAVTTFKSVVQSADKKLAEEAKSNKDIKEGVGQQVKSGVSQRTPGKQ